MRTLVLGASGKIGKYFKKTKKNYIFTYYRNKIKRGIKFDITNDKLNLLIEKKKINKIIFLSAISDPDECKRRKKYSQKVNVTFTKKMIDQIKKKNIYLIYFSSEYVFSGRKKNYCEESRADPINLYGLQKLKIENYIKKNLENFSILRICKTYGDNLQIRGLLSDFINQVISGKRKFHAATDQIFNPLYIKDLLKIVSFFEQNQTQGIFNVGGPKSHNRYAIYKMIKNSLKKKFKNLYIKKIKMTNLSFFEKRPKNLSMNVNKLKKTINFELTNVDYVIKKMVNKI